MYINKEKNDHVLQCTNIYPHTALVAELGSHSFTRRRSPIPVFTSPGRRPPQAAGVECSSRAREAYGCKNIGMVICMICTCIYLYIYIYVYTYIYTYKERDAQLIHSIYTHVYDQGMKCPSHPLHVYTHIRICMRVHNYKEWHDRFHSIRIRIRRGHGTPCTSYTHIYVCTFACLYRC